MLCCSLQVETALGRQLRPPQAAAALPPPRYSLTELPGDIGGGPASKHTGGEGAPPLAEDTGGGQALNYTGGGGPPTLADDTGGGAAMADAAENTGGGNLPSAQNPWRARVLVNRRITREGQPREVSTYSVIGLPNTV